jgi:hypothetical protein
MSQGELISLVEMNCFRWVMLLADSLPQKFNWCQAIRRRRLRRYWSTSETFLEDLPQLEWIAIHVARAHFRSSAREKEGSKCPRPGPWWPKESPTAEAQSQSEKSFKIQNLKWAGAVRLGRCPRQSERSEMEVGDLSEPTAPTFNLFSLLL